MRVGESAAHSTPGAMRTCYNDFAICRGEMAEWLKAHAWKACIVERLSRVRIPLSPPAFLFSQI